MSATWLRWAVAFLCISLVAAALTLLELPLQVNYVAKTCFFAFLVAFIFAATASALASP